MVTLLGFHCCFDYNLIVQLKVRCWRISSFHIFFMQVPFQSGAHSSDSVDSELQLQYFDYLGKHRHGCANILFGFAFLYENLQLLMSYIRLFLSYSAFIHHQPLVRYPILNFFINIRIRISQWLPGHFASGKCSLDSPVTWFDFLSCCDVSLLPTQIRLYSESTWSFQILGMKFEEKRKEKEKWEVWLHQNVFFYVWRLKKMARVSRCFLMQPAPRPLELINWLFIYVLLTHVISSIKHLMLMVLARCQTSVLLGVVNYEVGIFYFGWCI